MGQEFHVVRCFACQSFQVQQVKKVNKWSCKLCGEKQSLLKEFGRGSGADCRRHVQKLNAMRGAAMEAQERSTSSLCRAIEEEEEEEEQTDCQVSRWNKYLDDTPDELEPREEMEEKVSMERQHLTGKKMIDRKRRRPDEEPDEASSDRPEQFHRLKLQGPSASTRKRSPQSASAACFPSADCQAQERTNPCSSLRGQLAGGATSGPNISPLFLSPSMFESGEDLSFDENDFLTNQEV